MQSEANKKWMRENTRVVSVKFTKNTEQRYLDFLEGKPIATTLKRGLDLLMEQEAQKEK